MRGRVSGLFGRVHAAVILTCLAAQSFAAGPATIAGPHGEGGSIKRVNGEDYISYTYIEAPGAVGTPAVFNVFRPRSDPPEGLPKPRIAPDDVGSWAFIGEGSLAYMSAMMDLDDHGIVTWTFMTPDKLEKYRPTANVPPPAATVTSAPVAPAEAAMAERVKEIDDLDQQIFDRMHAVGQGLWVVEHDPAKTRALQDNLHAWTIRREKDCHLVMQSASVDKSWQEAVAKKDVLYGCFVTKAQERLAAYDKALAEMEAKNLTPESWSAIAGIMPAPEKEPPSTDPAQRLMDLEFEVRAMQGQAGVAAMKKFGRGGSAGRIENAYELWKDERDRSCAPKRSNRANPATASPATLNCLIAKTSERIALYQKALDEMVAGKLSDETSAAVGLK